MLDLEQERKEKGLLVVKYEKKEKKEALLRNERERCIASEKEKNKELQRKLQRTVASEKEKIEGLQRELAIATEPTIYDLVQANNFFCE
jgi:hypothetical protein